MTEKVRLEAIIHGRVQGVGFRYFTRREAQAMDLKGYVKNEWDGTVKAVAEGNRATLRKFLNKLRRGPGTAFVRRVEENWGEATGEFRSFGVRY